MYDRVRKDLVRKWFDIDQDASSLETTRLREAEERRQEADYYWELLKKAFAPG